MAAPAKQQPELNLQGSLFATGTFAAETPPDPHPETTPATAGSEPLPELLAESDPDRPRQRRASKAPATDNAPAPESSAEAAAEPDDDSDPKKSVSSSMLDCSTALGWLEQCGVLGQCSVRPQAGVTDPKRTKPVLAALSVEQVR